MAPSTGTKVYTLVFTSGTGPSETLGTFTLEDDGTVSVYGGPLIHTLARGGLLGPDGETRIPTTEGKAFFEELPSAFRSGYYSVYPEGQDDDEEDEGDGDTES